MSSCKHRMYFSIFCVLSCTLISTTGANHASDINSKENSMSVSVIQELTKRMNDMELREKIYIKALQRIEKEHEVEINGLKTEIAKQKTQLEILQRKNTRQAHLLSTLMRRVQAHSVSLSPDPEPASLDTVSMLSGEFSEEKHKISVENTVNRIRRAENEITVAFSAGLTHIVSHAGSHQNIVFDHVETNIGNGYNPRHGVFTAPVSGLYLLYSSILSIYNGEVWCQIVVNGVRKMSLYASGTDGHYDQGSQMIIVHLQQGDDVAVQNYNTDHDIYGNLDIYSTFSGVLLQQTFSQSGTIVG